MNNTKKTTKKIDNEFIIDKCGLIHWFLFRLRIIKKL